MGKPIPESVTLQSGKFLEIEIVHNLKDRDIKVWKGKYDNWVSIFQSNVVVQFLVIPLLYSGNGPQSLARSHVKMFHKLTARGLCTALLYSPASPQYALLSEVELGEAS